MDTHSSDQDRLDSTTSADASAPPEPPTPPIDDGRFSVPWALPDEETDRDDR